MSTAVTPEGPVIGGASVARDVVIVRERRPVSEGVVELTLGRPDGSRLPDWAPGAHIDLVLPDGAVRQYSLCGDRWDASVYRVAVQREPGGRGGSVLLHDKMPVGSMLRFGGPRNNFRLTPSERHLFIAGGIGITPLLPMLRQTDMLGLEWQLLYLGRGRNRLAYLDELQRYGSRVTVHCADEAGRADLDAWRPTDPRTRVFACGPERLLDAVEAWGTLDGAFPAKTERFVAVGREMTRPQSRFEVVAARTGATTTVARDETIVAALRRVGVDILTSCGQGVCGTCETAVIEGHPDHRDSLLDDRERAESQCIFPCVSRCRDRTLTLDI